MTYVVEKCDDLNTLTWEALGTVTAAANGLIVYTDDPLPPTGIRFYRLRMP
jgi:hypothetical protein